MNTPVVSCTTALACHKSIETRVTYPVPKAEQAAIQHVPFGQPLVHDSGEDMHATPGRACVDIPQEL